LENLNLTNTERLIGLNLSYEPEKKRHNTHYLCSLLIFSLLEIFSKPSANSARLIISLLC
jgi:hypothetical protein